MSGMDGTVAEKIMSGALAKYGHWDDETAKLAQTVVERVDTENIETVRLVFADQHGILRGKTIAARMLTSAFASGIGVPSTLLLKDTSHRTVFEVWNGETAGIDKLLGGASDVLLVADPNCFFPLPWSPHSASLMCDVMDRSGTLIDF
jgi:glutamine synthetase